MVKNLWIPILALVLIGGIAWYMTSSDPGESSAESESAAQTDDVSRPPVLVGAPRAAPPPIASSSVHTSHEGACRITGVVRRDKQPAPAHVTLYPGRGLRPTYQKRLLLPLPIGEAIAESEAGDDGTFLFEGLAPGAYMAIARADDGATAMGPYIIRPTQLEDSRWLNLVGGDRVFEGEAVWADGRPFRGFVCPKPDGERLPQVATDANGWFRISGLPAGVVALRFVEPDRFASTVGVMVPASGPVRIVVDEGLQTRTGLVVAADDESPVAGAIVRYVSGLRDRHRLLSARTTTADDGTFSYRMLREIGGFEVRAPGFKPTDLTSKAGEAVVIRLPRKGRIVGRVVEQGTGRPVGGVPIHATFVGSDGLRSPLAVSAVDGTFLVDVGPGSTRLWAFGGGYVSADITRMTTGGVVPIRLTVDAGAKIERTIEVVPAARAVGRVLDPEGEPVPDRLVLLKHAIRWNGFRVSWRHKEQAAAVTDAEGRFSFETLVPGFPVFFETKAATGLPGEVGPLTPARGATVDATIVMPEAQWLPVRVVEKATGQGIAGVSVKGQQPEHYQVALETGPGGRVELGPLRPGEVKVGVHHRDYCGFGYRLGSDDGRRVEDVGERREELVIELERALFVRGRIVNPPDVMPLAIGIFPVGAPAELGHGVEGLEHLIRGRFRFGPLAPGPYDIVLLGPGSDSTRRQLSRWTVEAGRDEIELEVTDADEETADVLLVDVATLDGRPVDGWIRLLGSRRIHVHTDSFAKGRYEVAGVSWGGPVWIEIVRPRTEKGELFGALRHGPITLAPGRVRLVVPPERLIGGRILLEDGSPVTGLSVLADPARPAEAAPFVQSRARARTDHLGRFHIDGLAEGPHRLSFSTPPNLGLAELPVVQAGETNVEIRLEAGVTATVHVADSMGTPIGGARVLAALPGRPDVRRTVETDAGGVATLTGLRGAGSYDLTVVPPSDQEGLLDAWQEAWRPEPTRLRLGAGETVRGVVRQNGTPLPDAVVWWMDDRKRWRRARTAQAGTFRLTVVPQAKVFLCADPPHTVRRDAEAVPLEVAPGTTDVVLDL